MMASLDIFGFTLKILGSERNNWPHYLLVWVAVYLDIQGISKENISRTLLFIFIVYYFSTLKLDLFKWFEYEIGLNIGNNLMPSFLIIWINKYSHGDNIYLFFYIFNVLIAFIYFIISFLTFSFIVPIIYWFV